MTAPTDPVPEIENGVAVELSGTNRIVPELVLICPSICNKDEHCPMPTLKIAAQTICTMERALAIDGYRRLIVIVPGSEVELAAGLIRDSPVAVVF